MDKDYDQLLEKLKDGVISELNIESSEFNAFQKILMKFPQVKNITGKANRNGVITYFYNKT